VDFEQKEQAINKLQADHVVGLFNLLLVKTNFVKTKT
jgi:hypothetical protein